MDISCPCGAEVLLVLLVVVMSSGIVATYSIAVSHDHVRAAWPYISDTGDHAPERFVFSLMCCVSGPIVIMIVLVHFKHIKLLVDSGLWRVFNCITFFIGCLAGCGLFLIGSFQNRTSLSFLHYTGAVMLFGGSLIYCSCVTLMSHFIIKVKLMKTVIRATLCLCVLGGIITQLVATFIANLQYDDDHDKNKHGRFHWSPSDKGYTAHLISTGSEWFIMIVIFCFFFTYITDFRNIRVSTAVTLKENHWYYRPAPGAVQPTN
ncbi:DNA damage-regulated autophagy modulator protein 2-like [Dysidea avara]|uniref:DNA damage-regulated autophagy modulator protein 2-like n=1 Tax=Dysidea avara TaxID=196820 RepID=UPI0033262248